MIVPTLVRHLHDTVPIARCMQIRAGASGDDGGVVLEAPLAVNINDKGTAFGGTLATIATLAGWAMTNVLALEVADNVDVVVVSGNIEYRAPVRNATIRARCTPPAASERERFESDLKEFGRARIELDAIVRERNTLCVRYTGVFIARIESREKP